MLKLLKSHFIKSKRGIERLTYGILPCLCLIFFVIVKSLWPSISDVNLQNSFDYFLSVACIFCLGIVCPVHFHHEFETQFAYELRIGICRTKLWSSHYLYIIGVLFYEVIMSYGLYILVGKFFSLWRVEGPFFINGFYLIYYLIGMVLLYMFVSVRYGMSASVLLATFLILSGIIFSSTDLGMEIWQFFPWVWPLKLAYLGYPVMNKLMMMNGAFTLMILAITCIWYNRWQGPRELEE